MIVLDIPIGYFIPELFGWLFLVFVIILETFLLSKLLKKYKIKTVLVLVIAANLLTTLFGYVYGEVTDLDIKSHLGHVINLVPFDYHNYKYSFGRVSTIYIASFMGTMILETLLFYVGLKRYGLKFKEVALKSLIINLASYFVGLIIIVLYISQLN